MTGRFAPLALALLALAACHRQPAGTAQPSEDAAAQAHTGAKALADIAAAEEAARAPLPEDATPPPSKPASRKTKRSVPEGRADTPPAGNETAPQ